MSRIERVPHARAGVLVRIIYSLAGRGVRRMTGRADLVAVENLRSRFNAAVGLGSLGFNDGAVCARLEPDADAELPAAPLAAVGGP